jgi:hypothetical protein
VVYSFLHTTKDLGDPGSSRGTLERVRVDLTIYNVELMKILSLVYFTDERKSLRHAQCSVRSGVSYTK